MPTAVDGCGVVTFGLELERMAHAFSRLEALEGARARPLRCAPARSSSGATGPRTRSSCAWATAGPRRAARRGCSVRCAPGSASRSRPRTEHSVRSSALAAFAARLGFEIGDLGNVLVVNSRGEVVGEVRVHRAATPR